MNDNIAHGKFTYVVNPKGDLIIGKRCNPNNPKERSPHPTLIGGHNPPVQCAGILECVKGRIVSYNNESGHYKPNPKSLATVEKTMEKLKQTNPEIFSQNYKGGIAHE